MAPVLPCLFGATWGAAAPVLVPLSICVVFSWDQSVRVPGDLGPHPCVFLLGSSACLSHSLHLPVSVSLVYPVSTLSSVDSSVPELW